MLHVLVANSCRPDCCISSPQINTGSLVFVQLKGLLNEGIPMFQVADRAHEVPGSDRSCSPCTCDMSHDVMLKSLLPYLGQLPTSSLHACLRRTTMLQVATKSIRPIRTRHQSQTSMTLQPSPDVLKHMQATARDCVSDMSRSSCGYLWRMAACQLTLSSVDLLAAITLTSAGKLLASPGSKLQRCWSLQIPLAAALLLVAAHVP